MIISVLPTGTELYFASQKSKEQLIEDGNPLLCHKSPIHAQQQVPDLSYKILFHSRNLLLPSKHCSMRSIQSGIGINYDYSKIKFYGDQVQNAEPLDMFKNNQQEIEALITQIRQCYQQEQGDDMKKAKLTKALRKAQAVPLSYVNEKLTSLGYKPVYEGQDQNHLWGDIRFGSNIIAPANYPSSVNLFVLKTTERLSLVQTNITDKVHAPSHYNDLWESATELCTDGFGYLAYHVQKNTTIIEYESVVLFAETVQKCTIKENEILSV